MARKPGRGRVRPLIPLEMRVCTLEMHNNTNLEVVLQQQQQSQKAASKSKSTTTSLWLASNPSKRWGEIFFLAYTPFWLTLCLGIVVPYKLYESFTELEYLPLGLISALPTFLIPLILVGKVDRSMHLKDRYWVKVPHTTFLLTHVCFLFYHVASNMTLRKLQNSVFGLPSSIQCVTEEAAWVLALAYFIAYLETIAISNFPYYQFVDRASMYKVGSLFYAIYLCCKLSHVLKD